MKDLSDFECYMVEEELSENTREVYLRSVRMFFSEYDELNKLNLISWKNELLENSKPRTVNLRLTAIERYCKFKEICIPVKRVKEHKMSSVENVITPKQYQQLIKGLKADGNVRWVAIVKLMAKTGGRVSEVRRFTKGDLKRGYVDLRTKGKIRRIYFPKSLVKEISEYIADMSDDAVICSCKNGKPLTSRGIAGGLQRYAKIYSIPKEVMHPHSFRHFFAIEFLKRNNNISLLADLLGHSGVNTTMIYLRMSQEQQKEAIDSAVNW